MAIPIMGHPRITLAISLIAAILGVCSLFFIRVEESPRISAPTFTVEVQKTAANAEEMDVAIAREIGEAVAGIPGIRHCVSVCSEDGMCRTDVVFSPNDDPRLCETRLRDVLRNINGVRVARKDEECVFICALTAKEDHVPVGVPDRRIVSRIHAINGVASVEVVGRRTRRVTVTLSAVKMAALGLSRAQVDSAIRTMGMLADVADGSGDFMLKVYGDLKGSEDLANCVVRFDPQTLGLVLLGDIAKIEIDDVPDRTVLVDGEESAILKVRAKEGCDSVALAKAVRSAVDGYMATLTGGVRLKVCADASERTVKFMRRTAWMPIASFLIVFFVLLALWRNWRMAVIPILTMVATVLSVFVVEWVMGWSLNTMTVFGLVLFSGALVDSSLLVVDRALDEYNKGEKDIRRSAGLALERSFKPIIGGTVVSVISFLPLVFARDAGVWIYLQFAFLACVAMTFAAVFAITLTPVLFAAWGRPSVEIIERRKPQVLIDFWRRFFTKASSFLVEHVGVSGFVLIAGSVFLGWLIWTLPSPGMPMKGVRGIDIELEMVQAPTHEEIKKIVSKASKRLLSFGEVECAIASLGEGVLKVKGDGLARISVSFRTVLGAAEAERVAMGMKSALSEVSPSLIARLFVPNAKASGNRYRGLEFYLSTKDGDSLGLADLSRLVLERLEKSSLVEEVSCGDVSSVAQASIALDKPAAEAFGVSVGTVQNALIARFAPHRLDGVRLQGADGGVFVGEDLGAGDIVSRLAGINIPASDGAQIPLLSLGTLSMGKCPRQVARCNGSMGVRFVVRTKDNISGAEARRSLLKVIAPHEPFFVEWTEIGDVDAEGVVKGDWKVIVLSLIFLYLLLVAVYESWRVPIAATGCAVMADLAVVWAMRCFDIDLDIYAVVALMAVSGFAVKSSLIIIDAVRHSVAGAKDGKDAAKAGAIRMFNLSQMVAWTSIAGVVPLVTPLFGDAYDESACVLGVAAVIGLLTIALIGLLFVPAWYVASNVRRDGTHGF